MVEMELAHIFLLFNLFLRVNCMAYFFVRTFYANFKDTKLNSSNITNYESNLLTLCFLKTKKVIFQIS
jgi:hypothetical protein